MWIILLNQLGSLNKITFCDCKSKSFKILSDHLMKTSEFLWIGMMSLKALISLANLIYNFPCISIKKIKLFLQIWSIIKSALFGYAFSQYPFLPCFWKFKILSQTFYLVCQIFFSLLVLFKNDSKTYLFFWMVD